MKKLILNLTMIIGVLLFSTGCARTYGFNNDILNNKVKDNLTKNSSTSVNIVFINQDTKDQSFPSRIDGMNSAVGIHLKTDEISSNVAKKFMKQYFTKVSVSNSVNKDFDISLSAEITEYAIPTLGWSDNTTANFSHKILVYKRGKKVIERNFPLKTYNSDVFMNFNFSNGIMPHDLAADFTHFVLFDLLEKEIKPELVKIVNAP